MYKNILVALENSVTDEVILRHIRGLAKSLGSKLVLMHVADGFVARNQEQLNLEDSQEISADREYLASRQTELSREGFTVRTLLALGDPATQLVNAAKQEGCDLIAMATHGHKGIEDLVLGSVATAVRHKTEIPVLMVKAPGKK
jgi:nucleotide-binding universal stress UspA family protein